MATFGRNQTAVPKSSRRNLKNPTPPTSTPLQRSGTVPTTERRLRNAPERDLTPSPLSEVPSSPEIATAPMPDPTEASTSTPLNTEPGQPLESPALQGTTSTAVTSGSSDEANTARLVLATLLKVAEGQDTLLRHLQTMQPPQPPTIQPQLQPPTVSAQPQQPPITPEQPPLPFPASVPYPQVPTAAPVPAHLPTTTGFMPPTSNTGHGAYSLQSLFPNIEESLLLAIGRHTLRPGQISKLDTRLRDKHVASSLEYENGMLVHKEKLPSSKDFPTFESLHYPLQRYFSVLQAQVIASALPPVLTLFIVGCNDYISLLNAMHLDYEWTAVLNYHFAVHALRLSEMAQGIYHLWGKIDTECQNRYLVGHTRTRTSRDRGSHKGVGDNSKTQTCNDFNFRTCYREKCTRIHKCRGCDNPDHGILKCPKKST